MPAAIANRALAWLFTVDAGGFSGLMTYPESPIPNLPLPGSRSTRGLVTATQKASRRADEPRRNPVARFIRDLSDAPTGRRVPGTVGVSVFAGVVSLLASGYLVPSGLSLAYGDALAHLTIARRLFDTLNNPGLEQLGTVWLPAPHLLLAPFVLLLWAWQTGWGAAVLGALCLAATAAGSYRAAARWGYGLLPRLAVVMVIVLNPSMLYLYSTALTEPVLIAATAGCFAGLSNLATKKRRLSPGEIAVFAGLPAAIAVLSRYEGWAVALAGAIFVGLVSWKQHGHDLRRTADSVLGFVAVPVAAALWWVAFNWVMLGDPLAFIFGPYSASALQEEMVAAGLSTKGDLGRTIATLNYAVGTTVGPLLSGIALFGLVLAMFARTPIRMLGYLATTLVTYWFMIVSLFLGQAIILNPATTDTSVWNNRYGMASILPMAALVGLGLEVVVQGSRRLRRGFGRVVRLTIAGAVLVAVLGQAGWQLQAPDERALVLQEAHSQLRDSAGARAAAEWLGANYDGGMILLDESVAANSVLPLAGLPLRNYYLRASDQLFTEALANPTAHARWLWVSTDDSDAVRQALAGSTELRSAYRLAHSQPGVDLYRRIEA